MDKDATILMLAEKLYICSRLLTRAAERLEWDRNEVQELIAELRGSLNASIQEVDGKSKRFIYCRNCSAILEVGVWSSNDLPR